MKESCFRARTLGLFAAASLLVSSMAAQSLDTIEINQAIGRQLNGAANFVAGKATAVRAFMTDAVTVDPAQTSARILKDGVEVATIPPVSYSAATKVVDFLCPTMDTCGRWAAGSYVFEVTVNGQKKSTDGTVYRFVDRQKLRILARPVKGLFSGKIVSVPDDSWKTMWTLTRATYPVADDGILWDTRDEFDASNIDIDTDDGRTALWVAITDAQPKGCATNPKGDGCYDLIVAFIGQNPKNGSGALAGYTMGRPTNIVVATDVDAAATVAHEIAHTMGIGDTYPGGSLHCIANPAPDGYVGDDWDDRSKKTSCTAGRQAAADIRATLVPASASPYEVNGRGALPDMAEYMGEGNGSPSSRFWTSPDGYDWLFKQLAPPAPTAKLQRRLASPVAAVEFNGLISAGGAVQLRPWQSYMTTDALPVNSGAYTVQAVDAAGAVLAKQGFDVSFKVLTNPPTVLATAAFEGDILFPAGTVKFQVLNGTTVIAELPVSANDPVVTNVAVQANADTTNTITWAATDADGDKLTYDVEYSPDPTNPSAEWELIGNNLTAATLTYDFAGLPGGANAAIRVTANDGVRNGASQSATFAVPFKAPDVYIDTPAGGTYRAGDRILLAGEGIDLQDSVVGDSRLTWSSNISGKLGTGGDLEVTLPAGAHTVTLTATNSGGVSASKSIAITVK